MILTRLDPSSLEAKQIVVTPNSGMQMMIDDIDKKFGSAWNKPTLPSDEVNTIMYRAGAKGYRDQLLKEIHATSPKGLK